MTQKNEEKTQTPTQTPASEPSEQEQDSKNKTEQAETVSDEGVKDDGSGTHGRPSDDSDPGHS